MLITTACQDNPIALLGFIPEYLGEKTREGNVKKYIRDSVCDIANTSLTYSHTPDAVFALEKGGNAALFFLEIDRGTEIVSDPEKGVLKGVVWYLNYWVEKKYTRYEADFGKTFTSFHTLFITPSPMRLQHIREAVTTLPFRRSQAKRLLWGTIQAHITADWLFESIWQALDVNDQTLYRIG
jgi:hypothetical protein